jgi:hypothetical protein
MQVVVANALRGVAFPVRAIYFDKTEDARLPGGLEWFEQCA